MTPTAEEAAQALRDVESIRSRSMQLRSYQYAAPQLILWGVFWVIGYGASDFAPDYANHIWIGIAALWLLLYVFYFARSSSPASATVHNAEDARLQRRYRLRILGLGLVACLMIFGTALIMQPRGIEMAAYVPLLVAAAYLGAGFWGAGSRYIVVGLGLATLALAGYILLPQYFLLLMAIAGGGALILTGLWFLKA
jgi:hypothetical protein